MLRLLPLPKGGPGLILPRRPLFSSLGEASMTDTAAVLLSLAASFGLPVAVFIAWKFWHDT